MANEFKVKKGLIVDGTNTVLDIQGTQGQLFSVTDSLTGDLFSVSDVSGIPILNVNSSGIVTIDGSLQLADNDKIQIGDAQDLELYHDGSNSYIKDNGTGSFIINANGSNRFFVGSDVGVLAGTDFFIEAGRKLLLDGAGGHTYIEEESDSNLKFYVGGSEMVNFTNDKLYFNSELKLTGNVTGTATGCAALGRNHAYNTLELKGYGAELMIGAQSTAININYRTCNSGASGHTPTDWYWRAGSSSSYSDHYFGRVKAEDLIFGDTGDNGNGRLIYQNDTSGNQGTVGYGVLKQRDVNKQSVSGQATHIGGYIWYTIKIPSGYSNQGLGSDIEVVVRTGGRHHNGKTLQKFLISVGNGTTANIGNLNDINILQTLDSRIAGSYGGGATTCEFYYRTSVANNTGEVILRLYRADREPVTVVEINPQGAWASNNSTYTPSLVCHGLGTTFDSSTGKGQINQTRPTANLSSPIVLQKAGFTQTTASSGKLDVSANGPASGASHEIARFVNLGSLATSSYMYIGASSGTDWRLGKNINGTSGNTNFGIATHSGTTLALEIDGSNNATFAGTLTLSGKSSATQYIKQETHGDLLIQTTHGYFKAGPGNTSYCHLTTDRGRFYMNKRIVLDTGIFASYDEDLKLYRADSSSHSMTLSTTAATFTHDVVAYSDRKLKENVKTLDGSKVLKMRGVSFDRIDTGLPSSGVIAQEIQEVAPELVSESNGTLGVSYGNLTGYLIEAIKELKSEIEQLKKQIK